MIKLHKVNKRYGKFRALADVSLDVKKGDIYGLVGKNGAGKTTIFKAILGLVRYSGEISIAGSKNSFEFLKNRRKIGFFIDSGFFNNLSARENLRYYCRLLGVKNQKAEIQRVLEVVGLEKVRKRYKSFSMGMKQRLGIARAILGNPEILIFDEPANGLDPQGIADIRALMKKLNKDGKTILISSHILGELEHTATRFGIIDEGKVLKELQKNDLKSSTNYVKLKINDLAKAKTALKKAGIKVFGEGLDATSLEDYYFELIGGSNV
ncbi:ATP-binding cassette domain-containing protein [Candidatus Saccharibacteria bacterium]|nr:ATP-binding cassette domain-containing protein [Candidatus Saccharibacteria bacterium]